jgi:hypothetical protein
MQLLQSVDVRPSATGAGPGADAVIFGSSTLSLTCPSSGIIAKVASSSDGTANVLVDNYIDVTVTAGGTTSGPFNICGAGGPTSSCFTASYHKASEGGGLIGVDPDTLVATGGVPAIDISDKLTSGVNQTKFDLVDIGGYLASSTLYLYTNCTSAGTSSGQISGNPIPSTNPPASDLTQTFAFNSTNTKVVQQIYDLSFAETDGTLTIANGTIPTVTDQAIDPTKWHDYVSGTSFATSECLIHDGETLHTKHACKLYTVTCQVGQGSTGTGAQCPVSTIRNEVFADVFDGPPFTLPDIHVGNATFHQGIGYLMASEGWKGGACTFDPASGLQDDLCPQNLLTEFSGPGTFNSKGTTNHPNSAFISVAPVPQDRTRLLFNGSQVDKWVNTLSVQANFYSKPPVVPAPNNDFVAAPIQTITYGVSTDDALPSPEFPIATDSVLTNPVDCPVPGDPNPPPAKPFHPGDVTITVPGPGKYLVHFFATDCAGTEELLFYKDKTGSWQTTFYTAELNVDTVAPEVAAGPKLSPAPTMINGKLGYAVGQHVTATFRCSDELSGVSQCGSHTYSDPVHAPPPLTVTVDTSCPGEKTFTVGVKDLAQNHGTPKSVTYTVVGN